MTDCKHCGWCRTCVYLREETRKREEQERFTTKQHGPSTYDPKTGEIL